MARMSEGSIDAMPQTDPANGVFTVGRASTTQATLRAQMRF